MAAALSWVVSDADGGVTHVRRLQVRANHRNADSFRVFAAQLGIRQSQEHMGATVACDADR
jgi:hypothetical protein